MGGTKCLRRHLVRSQDIKDEDLLASVGTAIRNVAAFSLAADYPTLASIPHSLIIGYKNVLPSRLPRTTLSEKVLSFPIPFFELLDSSSHPWRDCGVKVLQKV
jgi:hypothetical protein